MAKTHIYFMPGLAAGPEIFENIELSPTLYELHFLKWLKPLSSIAALPASFKAGVGEKDSLCTV